MKHRLILLSLILLFFIGLQANPRSVEPPEHPGAENTLVSFEGEELRFFLEKRADGRVWWKLEGKYYFSNSSGEFQQRHIAYPFPEGDDLGPVQLLSLSFEENSGASVRLDSEAEHLWGFWMELPPQSLSPLTISYEQPVFGNRAAYIITSARSWGRPLAFARFTIVVDKSLRLVEAPFPGGSSEETDSAIIHSWDFFDFQPDKDLELRFLEG